MMQSSTINMFGFKYKGSCNCDGSLTEKWELGEYQLRIKATRFKIKQNGSTIKSWTPIDQLQTVLSNVALQKA